MPIAKPEEWKKWMDSSKDSYGSCCVGVAKRVMEILDGPGWQNRVINKEDTYNLINQADKDVKAGGITGFMAGMVAQMVSQCHSLGEEFRRAWNEEHGVKKENDKGGVVNPAIITIGVKKS